MKSSSTCTVILPVSREFTRFRTAFLDSGVQLQRDIFGNLDTSWDGVDQAWVDTNLGTHDFLLAIEPAMKLTLKCHLTMMDASDRGLFD